MRKNSNDKCIPRKNKSIFTRRGKRNFCVKCEAEYVFGKKHLCQNELSYKNIEEIELPLEEKERLVAKLIHDISNEESKGSNDKKSNEIRLAQKKGKQLIVFLNPLQSAKRDIKRQISVDDLSKISTDLNLSTNKTQSIAAAICMCTRNRRAIESNLREKIEGRNHAVDSLFETVSCDVVDRCKGEDVLSSQIMVFCINREDLVQTVTRKRDLKR
ncbi:hypothetical protein QAD02_021693 [Eretmocerus hayati]|uniref:Uncharacterized protein n=1 Tax=Eretmocerus hayati TaxID=131215 RepID=A0ACC2PQL0_9HYME|nr:hypothetical protein QAD02_021693 [Eretmocerus hayati]